jgi:hypothetical protein
VQFWTLQYRSRAEAEADFQYLWKEKRVTGELALRTERDNVTFLEIASERDLPSQLLDRLKGVRV